jgi:hypothetical protein
MIHLCTSLLHPSEVCIEVDGHGKDLFLEHLKEIIKLMESKGNCSQLNRLLEHQIREYMRKFPTGNVENKRSKKYVGRETDLTHATELVLFILFFCQRGIPTNISSFLFL